MAMSVLKVMEKSVREMFPGCRDVSAFGRHGGPVVELTTEQDGNIMVVWAYAHPREAKVTPGPDPTKGPECVYEDTPIVLIYKHLNDKVRTVEEAKETARTKYDDKFGDYVPTEADIDRLEN
jgi:hypothetical protein